MRPYTGAMPEGACSLPRAPLSLAPWLPNGTDMSGSIGFALCGLIGLGGGVTAPDGPKAEILQTDLHTPPGD